jgi:hypothetical protein
MPVTIPPSGRRERKQGERAVQANISLNPDAPRRACGPSARRRLAWFVGRQDCAAYAFDPI